MPKKKDGKVITWKEYFKLWGEGIKNITPQQKVSNEFNSMIIVLTGFIISLVALIIFRDKLIVSWFAYGLILIFAGNLYSTLIKCISLYQQKAFFKNIEKQLKGEEVEDEIIILEEGKQKGMSTSAMTLGKYVEDDKNKLKGGKEKK